MKFVDFLPYDKSIWLFPNGFCLVERTPSLRQQSFLYADGDILSVKAIEFFKLTPSDNPEVAVVVANEPPVLMPTELFDANDTMKLIALQYDTTKVEQTFNTDVNVYQMLYFLYKNEKSAVERLCVQAHYLSYWSLAYHFVLQECASENLIWLDEHDGYLELLVQKNNKPMLFNRFNYVQPEDELYYLMNVKQQYQLDDETLVCYHSYLTRPSLKSLLEKYIDKYKIID